MKVSKPDDDKAIGPTRSPAAGPTVIDVDIDPESEGYRAIHYPYPSDFSQRGIPKSSLLESTRPD